MSQFEIKNLPDKTQGVFSLVHWDSNQVILKCTGKLTNKSDLSDIKPEKIDSLLQVSPDAYLDLSGDLSFFVRHSCNPNTTVKIIAKNAFLISTRAIKPNEELTFDYSTTSTDSIDEWKIDCKCGSWNCRKQISGFNTLPAQTKEQYLKQNIIPNYIKNISSK